MSHDYRRHGVTSLFAALDIATGRVIGKCYARHRAAEERHVYPRAPSCVEAENLQDGPCVIKRRRMRQGEKQKHETGGNEECAPILGLIALTTFIPYSGKPKIARNVASPNS